MGIWMQGKGVLVTKQELARSLGKYSATNAARAPRGHPSAFPLPFGGQCRGTQAAVKLQLAEGGWIRYGLNEQGRQLLELACQDERARLELAPLDVGHLTDVEMVAVIGGGGQKSAYPERWQW